MYSSTIFRSAAQPISYAPQLVTYPGYPSYPILIPGGGIGIPVHGVINGGVIQGGYPGLVPIQNPVGIPIQNPGGLPVENPVGVPIQNPVPIGGGVGQPIQPVQPVQTTPPVNPGTVIDEDTVAVEAA